MYKVSRAFTMIELIFVIVVMGILSKFGVEFLAQAYNNFIFSKINNALQSKSVSALESIASRLQFRIKDSVIARKDSTTFQALGGSTLGVDATTLEWVGMDVDGLRGDSNSTWGGVIDLDNSTATTLKAPGSDLNATNTIINALSYGHSGINDAAIYFVGSDSNINKYGWTNTGSGAAALSDHNSSVMHPISANVNDFNSSIAGVDFSGTDIYEYYKLAWSAYAVSLKDGNLTLYYDYQPWNGDSYLVQSDGTTPTKSALLMQNVDTFRFKSIGSVIKIQICVNSNIVEDYSLCKEKTIY